jgi:cytochrome c-type biogenesis protein CcmH
MAHAAAIGTGASAVAGAGAASSGGAGLLGAVLLVAALGAAGALALRSYEPAPAQAAGPASIESEMAAVARLAEAVRAHPGATLEQRRAELEQAVQREPNNGRAWALLGFMHAEANRFAESAAAFERALASSRRVALDPWVWCEYADVLGMAQGTLAGKPTEAIGKALELQRDHPKALEMAGSAAYERRDFAVAAEYWRRVLPQVEPGSPPHQALARAIERSERLAATALPGG